MSVTIPGVPEKMSREDYLRLIESVGLDVNNLVELTFGYRSIEATVIARDAEGHAFIEPKTTEIAVHRISIPIED